MKKKRKSIFLQVGHGDTGTNSSMLSPPRRLINLDFIKHMVKINSKSEIEITADGKTSHPAIFAAGDASSIPYKQIVAACSGGATAGLSAFNYVEKLKGKPGIRADWKKTIGDTVFHY